MRVRYYGSVLWDEAESGYPSKSGSMKQRGRLPELVLFKSCPRCLGDVHVKRDMYGEYKECLQCGYMVDLQATLVNERVKKVIRQVRRGKRGTAA